MHPNVSLNIKLLWIMSSEMVITLLQLLVLMRMLQITALTAYCIKSITKYSFFLNLLYIFLLFLTHRRKCIISWEMSIACPCNVPGEDASSHSSITSIPPNINGTMFSSFCKLFISVHIIQWRVCVPCLLFWRQNSN